MTENSRSRPATPCDAELKPCPFCGSEPTIERWHGGGPEKRMIACISDDCHVSPWVTGETMREAAGRWNGRSSRPPRHHYPWDDDDRPEVLLCGD